jgi:hypothetical protein
MLAFPTYGLIMKRFLLTLHLTSTAADMSGARSAEALHKSLEL